MLRKNNSKLAAIACTVFFCAGLPVQYAFAKTTVGDKIEHRVNKAKRSFAKEKRAEERAARNRKGKKNIVKDAGDKAKDLRDDAQTKGEELKEKVD